MSYAEVFEAFPAELRLPVARLVDVLKEEFTVKRSDIEGLQSAVRDLTTAQGRTEVRMEELVAAQARTEVRMEELAAAQTRTEVRLDELTAAQTRTDARIDRLAIAIDELTAAQVRTDARIDRLAIAIDALTAAQTRTEARIDRLDTTMAELAAAQARTEIRVDRLGTAMAELAAAQARTEVRMEEFAQAQALFRQTFTSQIGGLGARWGLQTEESFRQGIRTILGEVGFTTERFLTWDAAGEVFGHPEQVELDVVVQNGKTIVVEIKSSLDRANTYLFDRKVAFYARHSGRHIDRKVVIAPYADARAMAVAERLGIEVCTEAAEFQ